MSSTRGVRPSGLPLSGLSGGGGGGTDSVAMSHRSVGGLVGLDSHRSTSSGAASDTFDSHGHNEDEDELGVAKGSRYHAATLPGIAVPRGGAAGGVRQASSLAHNFSMLARLGGTVLGGSDEPTMEVGGLESIMPFVQGPASGKASTSTTATSSNPSMAFLKPKEPRLAHDAENRFTFATSAAGSTAVSQRGTARGGGSDGSFGSSDPSPLAADSLGAVHAIRREMRAAQERKEEALAAARLRGGSLLSFASPSSSSAGGAGAAAANVPLTPPPPPAAPKPYVRYTPKYNLPYGDVPRQVAPPPQPSASLGGAPLAQAVLGSSIANGGGGGGEHDLAQVRSTTLFSVTGSLTTHVGVALNPGVFGKDINADVFTPAILPGGGPTSPTSAITGRRATTRRGTATGETMAGSDTAGSVSGRRSQQGTSRAASSHRQRSQRSEEKEGTAAAEEDEDGDAEEELEQEEDGNDDGEPENDDTFLTGVNLADSTSSPTTHRGRPRQQQGLIPVTAGDGVVTVEELQKFHALTSVETAVRALPRFLRPTSEAVLQATTLASTTTTTSSPQKHRQSAPKPELPTLSIPSRVDVDELMSLSLASIDFGPEGEHDGTTRFTFPSTRVNLSQSVSRVRARTFEAYFTSPESRAILHDAYYWVMLRFFANGENAAAAEEASPRKRRSADSAGAEALNVPEMYAYRAYAANLKKYAEQEGFVRKQREWRRECDRIRQAEKESHAQIGTQVAGGGGASSSGGNSSPASSPQTTTLPSHHKEELQFPPAPVLTTKQKRQPLVLLGDIPHFDVQAKLNTGPAPITLFGTHADPSSSDALPPHKRPKSLRAASAPSGTSSTGVVDHASSDFLLSSLQSRISRHFVRLFLRVSHAHKDFFYLHYYDLLAQVLYYSFLVAYPASRPLLNHSFFKLRLLQLTSFWVMGFIPSNLTENLQRWRGDLAFITGEAGVNRAYQASAASEASSNGSGSHADAIRAEGENAEDDDDDDDEAGETAVALSASQALDDYVPPTTSNRTGGNGGTSHYVQQLEKRLNAHLAGNTKTARAKQQQQQQQAAAAAAQQLQQQQQAMLSSITSSSLLGASSSSLLPLTGAASPSPKRQQGLGATSLLGGVGVGSGGASTNEGGVVVATASALAHLSSTSSELTGDLLTDVGQRARRNPHRVPMRVTRHKVQLHHSALLADFLAERRFAHQSNHALRMPLTVPATGEEERAALLDHLLKHNEAARLATNELKAEYAGSKAGFSRLQAKQKKEVGEIGRKFDQERERALREASAFSKTLVAEFQDKKYADLKAPSKSLALRRLGHFRQAKEDGIGAVTSKSETSATLIKSALMM